MNFSTLKRLVSYTVVGLVINLVFTYPSGPTASPLALAIRVLLFVIGAELTSRWLKKSGRVGWSHRVREISLRFIPPALRQRLWRFAVDYPFLILALAIGLVWAWKAPAVEALPPISKSIYWTTNIVGVLWIVWNGVSLITYPSSNILDTAIRVLEKFVFVWFTLLAVRIFGTELADGIQLTVEHPEAALAIVVAFLLIQIADKFSSSRPLVAETARGCAAGGFSALSAARRERTPAEIHRTAAHEAGHLLTFASRDELPEDLSVTVYAEIGDGDLYRGFVNHGDGSLREQTESSLRWAMRMHLAGSEAESILLADRGDGAVMDNQKWLSSASTYLSAGFGEVFYSSPEGEAEREHNRAVLNSLKAACVEEVRSFLIANRQVLEALTLAIVQEKRMGKEQIAPYLAQVVLQD